ncbi:MAG: hypothetical protein PWQ74_387 [Methanobacteriaceae archaeon]|nr:hypothetical protein [Methanobacteriaceae archaeon]
MHFKKYKELGVFGDYETLRDFCEKGANPKEDKEEEKTKDKNNREERTYTHFQALMRDVYNHNKI